MKTHVLLIVSFFTLLINIPAARAQQFVGGSYGCSGQTPAHFEHTRVIEEPKKRKFFFLQVVLPTEAQRNGGYPCNWERRDHSVQVGVGVGSGSSFSGGSRGYSGGRGSYGGYSR